NLALLDKVLAEHAGLLGWVRPRGGMTAFPWLADGSDAREFCRALAKQGVLMAPGDGFGMPSHFRLGFATSGERFAASIERLTTFLDTQAQAHAHSSASVVSCSQSD